MKPHASHRFLHSCLLAGTILLVPGMTHGAPAGKSLPAARSGEKRVVLDCYYNNEWRTTAEGRYERYHYVWDDTTNSGFSQLGGIVLGLGAGLDTLSAAPTAASLKRASIYLIVDPDTPKESPNPHTIDPAEIEVIVTWVREGGRLILLGNDKGNAEFEHLNMLATRFGIRFNEDSRNRVVGKEYGTGTFEKFPNHVMFAGVKRIFMKELSTLHLQAPARPLLTDGKDVIIGYAKFGKGMVVAAGDPWFYNEYMDERRLPAGYDNPRTAENLFRWLLIGARTVPGVTPGQTEGKLRTDHSAVIAAEVKNHCANLPFVMPEVKVPVFPDRRMSIREFGAVSDGHTMNTGAFAAAIGACAKAGGGTVVVPAGTWLTGPIKIESNINLHLERGALVQFSNRIEDFPLIPSFDGRSRRFVITPPVSAFKATNIAITGEGIFDGAGEAWRYVKKEKQTERQWKELVASGGVVTPDGKEWWPSMAAMKGDASLKELDKSGRTPTPGDYASVREFIRPDLVMLVRCDGILLDGPTFRNSPRFHVRPMQSENIIIRNIKIYSPWFAQNGDGLDPTSCRNVVIYDINVDTGDDGICLKPGAIAPTQKPGPACENIVIADCVVYRAHGGFVIGSESYGGVRNISVRNCVFIETDIGLRFKSMRGNGGLVENVYIDGIQMRAMGNEAILFDMFYAGNAPEVEAEKSFSGKRAEPVTDRTPRFQNLFIKNVVCNGAKRAMLFNGLPEMPLRSITLENVSIAASQGAFFSDAEGINLKNCRIAADSGPVLTAIESRNILVEGGAYPGMPELFLSVEGAGSENIRLLGVDVSKAKIPKMLGPGVKPDAVTIEGR